MFGGRGRSLLRFSQRLGFPQTTSFCTNAKGTTSSNANKNDVVPTTDERYRMLENLDMMTAAKILFSDNPNKKKFGYDFHLVQFFFACLPSLAVYLVAQYARYEMRKMEADVEKKRKQKEEEEAKEKEKEMELNPPEEKEAKSNLELVEVKERLEKLEETVKEIVVESKKQSDSNLAKNQVTDAEKKSPKSSEPNDASSSSQSNKAVGEDRLDKHNSPKSKPDLGEEGKSLKATPNPSHPDPKGQNQG
ncbi:splicing regulatory glutamine/lysine-rich protein 1 [Arachis ipaensis]|uniref:splicing regulatory glutamine/lysine-rich protein 1 n=1 Tax=Arachis ipaensis TaxID=130454 RepID=UPI0007AEF301|nr:splicing regulatory glutamine/lysine-rich protein 1 [Arachis ipaensis]